MYCPKCGAQHVDPPRSCPSCRCDLARVNALLAREADTVEAAVIEKRYLRRLLYGAVYALAVVLAILWIVRFAVGEITTEDFTPFVGVLSWIGVFIFLLNLGFARRRKRLELAHTH